MRICTIGGTRFSGRAFTGLALEQGHDVTVFHRGGADEDPWPQARHLHGDRDGGLAALEGGGFDAVVDFCAYNPRHVREAADAVGEGRYVLISSLSAHREDARAGATEDDDVYEPPFPTTEEITWETYGPLKVAAERAATELHGDRSTIVRPHFIVGPHDPTDRFTSWVRRGASGARFLAPAPPDQPLQLIDARDLAAFVLHLCATDTTGTFGVATPPRRHTFGELLTASAAAAGTTLSVVWADEAFVRAHGLVATEEDDPFPLVTPEEPNGHLFDTSRAVAAGLTFRTVAETVADTLAWDRERGEPALRAGLEPARESELLAAFDGAS
jgi:nucleoside-diphosphate-sugar epimerase